MRRLCLIVVLGSLVGCAYPRRATHIQPAPPALLVSSRTPADVWSLRIASGELPPRKRGGLDWDSDGTGPDPFVRLYVGKRLVFETETLEDTTRPEWNVQLPRNLRVTSSDVFRIELWDRDTVVDADPVGQLQHSGLPSNALPDAEARLTLGFGASLDIIVSAPVGHRGVGVYFEARSDRLVLLEVEPLSPAGRAGLRAGDAIVGIGDERVAHMSSQEAGSQLSLASERAHKLSVLGPDGTEREVTLDKEPIWLVL